MNENLTIFQTCYRGTEKLVHMAAGPGKIMTLCIVKNNNLIRL